MARPYDNLFQRGPVIRDLTVPEDELVLRPAPLRQRSRRRIGPWLRRLYGTALVAWTLGLIAATTGFLHAQRANSNGVEPRATSGEVAVPVPEPVPPIRTETFTERARP